MTFSKVYNTEDLFEDIPDDPDNVIFKIPPEALEQLGWKEGDVLNITSENESIIIKKHG